jgi:hypothetical protein
VKGCIVARVRTDGVREKGIRPEDIQGLKYFKLLDRVLERLRRIGTERDRAGNRELFYDQYVSLLLLYFFSPVLTSLRGIQRASKLDKVQRIVQGSRVSLGSLSEAQHVFDPEPLRNILGELGKRMKPIATGKEAEALNELTAVDGTLLPALPRMAWALWLSETKRAAKLHLHFEVLKGTPARAMVTAANSSERQSLREMLEPGRLYVIDGGYESFRLFQTIIDEGSSFVGRVREQTTWKVIEERPLSNAAREAGVQVDLIVDLGGEKAEGVFKQSLRVVRVKIDKTKNGKPVELILVTNVLDLDAELIALAYRYRWQIELFFRWFKCILGCRHLLAKSQEGVQIQVYVALIASLLISLWTDSKPTKATFEMLCHYFSGWATEAELTEHIESLKNKTSK